MEITPVIVDPVYRTRSCSRNWNSFGPFERNGKLYLVYGGGNWLGYYATIYKSEDSGATWTALDVGNGPDYAGVFAADYRGDNQIHVVTPAYGTYAMSLGAFDLDAEAWGAIITGGPDASTGDMTLGARADGSYMVVYSAADARTYYVVYDGSWGAPVEISADVPGSNFANLQAAIRDSNDTMHVLYRNYQPGVGLIGIHYRQVAAGGSLGAAQVLPNGQVRRYFGLPCFWGSVVVFPHRVTPVGQPAKLYVYMGDPWTETTPAWSSEMVNNGTPAAVVENAAVAQDGKLWAYWVAFAGAFVFDAILRSLRSSGAWGDWEYVHDEMTYPTAPPPTWQHLHELSVMPLANSAIGIGSAIEIGSDCVGIYLHIPGLKPRRLQYRRPMPYGAGGFR